MLIVIALGGNALLQRGEPLEAEHQRKNVKLTADQIAKLVKAGHQVVICHGNGPQVGLLALQNDAYKKVKPYPLDVLDAESQGMIGYLIQQEVGNNIAPQPCATLLTQIIVDKDDPAFTNPTKPIGPVYNTQREAEAVAKERGWQIAADGKYFRRVVPSPQPKEIVEFSTIKALLDLKTTLICGGGGGIPVIKNQDGKLEGVEAVIDKDNTASLTAEKLNADTLIVLTDVPAVCINWGTPEEKSIKAASPKALRELDFAKGSMGPKITASCRFAENTGKKATIGRLSDVELIIEERAGTMIDPSIEGIEYY